MKTIFRQFLYVVLLAFCLVGCVKAQPTNQDYVVKKEFLSVLEKDGYINVQQKHQIEQRYLVAPENKSNAQVVESKGLMDYLIILVKVVAIIFLVVAFGKFIVKIADKIYKVIRLVPNYVYQLILLAVSLFATFKPEFFSKNESDYIVIFCTFSNLMILAWIGQQYSFLKKFDEFLLKLMNSQQANVFFSALGAAYFGAMTMLAHSYFLGFFTTLMICFTVMLAIASVMKVQAKNVFTQSELHKYMIAAYTGMLVVFSLLEKNTNFAIMDYLSFSFDYYVTLHLSFTLMILSKVFWNQKIAVKYLTIFFYVSILAVVGYVFYDTKVMSSIVLFAFFVTMITAVSRLYFSWGKIIGVALTGATLYGSALLLQHYSHYIYFLR